MSQEEILEVLNEEQEDTSSSLDTIVSDIKSQLSPSVKRSKNKPKIENPKLASGTQSDSTDFNSVFNHDPEIKVIIKESIKNQQEIARLTEVKPIEPIYYKIKLDDLPEERRMQYKNKLTLTTLIHRIEKEYESKTWLNKSNEKNEKVMKKIFEQNKLMTDSIETYLFKVKKN